MIGWVRLVWWDGGVWLDRLGEADVVGWGLGGCWLGRKLVCDMLLFVGFLDVLFVGLLDALFAGLLYIHYYIYIK